MSAKDRHDSLLNVMMGLLTKPEQQAILAYIGRSGLQRDDDLYVLLCLLKIGAVQIEQMEGSALIMRDYKDDLQQLLADAQDKIARVLAGGREDFLGKWQDIIGVAKDMDHALLVHRQAMLRDFATHLSEIDQRTATQRDLNKRLGAHIANLRPLLDLLTPSPTGMTRYSPTDLVLEAIRTEQASALQDALSWRHRKWQIAAQWFWRFATFLALVLLLYRG